MIDVLFFFLFFSLGLSTRAVLTRQGPSFPFFSLWSALFTLASPHESFRPDVHSLPFFFSFFLLDHRHRDEGPATLNATVDHVFFSFFSPSLLSCLSPYAAIDPRIRI